MSKCFRAASLLCLVLSLARSRDGTCQEYRPAEYQVKAAFLVNFAKFVEWPRSSFASQSSPLVIGVLGENPFHDDLARMIQNKTVDEHPLELRILNSPSQSANCHILFVSVSQKQQLPEVLRILKGSPVLTVGESERFTESGGMINFFLEGTKIRFQINHEAASRAGLKISSKLMSLASR